MFIFDEMDKMPLQLLDAIIPFAGYYGNINGVDTRKSIFFFIGFSFLFKLYVLNQRFYC
jgi:hypothetical protein